MSTHAVRLGRRSLAAIVIASAIGIIAFAWPLLASPQSAVSDRSGDAPWLFAIVMPLILICVLTQLSDGRSGGGMDAKGIALLGVLSAVIAALRPLGAGTFGIEPIWVILILGARALGPGFGFCLGAVSLFASALLTGGVGPWLPFQMLAAAWVGLGAGLLPAAPRGRRELLMLSAYAGVACLAYGLLLNLWLWPSLTGLPVGISFVPGAPLGENVGHWLAFTIATSLPFDIPRAVLTIVLIALLGAPVLAALRRASRIAAFDATPAFAPVPERVP